MGQLGSAEIICLIIGHVSEYTQWPYLYMIFNVSLNDTFDTLFWIFITIILSTIGQVSFGVRSIEHKYYLYILQISKSYSK